MIDDAERLRQVMQMLQHHRSWGPVKKYSQRELRVYFLVLALAGEVGEMANLVKKDWRGDPDYERRRQDLGKELIDVLNYGFMLAIELGIDDPIARMEHKLHKVERRKDYVDHVPARQSKRAARRTVGVGRKGSSRRTSGRPTRSKG